MTQQNEAIRLAETQSVKHLPFYEAVCDEKGFVWLRVLHQTFRLAYDPAEAEKLENIEGYGVQHGQWLAKQLQIALDKIRTGIQ